MCYACENKFVILIAPNTNKMLQKKLVVFVLHGGRYRHHMYERGELNQVLAIRFHVFGPNGTKDGTILFLPFSKSNTGMESFCS
jgi:hypothetical protein